MLNFLTGYRTYLTVITMVVHQILKANGIDIPDTTLSVGIDTFLGICAGYFKHVADKRNKTK